MTTTTQLCAQAERVARIAPLASMAKTHLDIATARASTSGADVAILTDLRDACAAIDRVIRHTEQQRLRLLRKAQRQGVTP